MPEYNTSPMRTGRPTLEDLMGGSNDRALIEFLQGQGIIESEDWLEDYLPGEELMTPKWLRELIRPEDLESINSRGRTDKKYEDSYYRDLMGLDPKQGIEIFEESLRPGSSTGGIPIVEKGPIEEALEIVEKRPFWLDDIPTENAVLDSPDPIPPQATGSRADIPGIKDGFRSGEMSLQDSLLGLGKVDFSEGGTFDAPYFQQYEGFEPSPFYFGNSPQAQGIAPIGKSSYTGSGGAQDSSAIENLMKLLFPGMGGAYKMAIEALKPVTHTLQAGYENIKPLSMDMDKQADLVTQMMPSELPDPMLNYLPSDKITSNYGPDYITSREGTGTPGFNQQSQVPVINNVSTVENDKLKDTLEMLLPAVFPGSSVLNLW